MESVPSSTSQPREVANYGCPPREAASHTREAVESVPSITSQPREVANCGWAPREAASHTREAVESVPSIPGSDHWMQYYVAPQEWEDNDENAEDDEDFPQGSE